MSSKIRAMRNLRQVAIVFAGLALVLLGTGIVFAVDCAEPTRACELVNSGEEIFTGRVVSPLRDDGTIGVEVRHVYRGSLHGRVDVVVSPLDSPFEAGETYLFYTSPASDGDRSMHLSNTCSTKPISGVQADEQSVLNELGGGNSAGSVFGALERSLDFRDHEALMGIPVVLKNGDHTYSVTTDAAGRFELNNVTPGTYKISATLPAELALKDSDDFQIFSHGCFNADLTAVSRSIISGRITLPAGLKVEGTGVFAVSTAGSGDRSAVADSQGRYMIRGLAPGEYVVGINTEANSPKLEAPYPPTYYPGTRNFEEAKKFVISGAEHFSEIDISVPTASDIVRIRVRATFEDGRPVKDAPIGVTYDGGSIRDGRNTDTRGIVFLPVVQGERVFVVGYRGVDSACLTPVPIGPASYPKLVDVVYSADGCREDFNLSHSGSLHTSVRGVFSEVKVFVSYQDGNPAYNAQVSIMSRRDKAPFVSAFLTDRNGQVDLPIPENQEFQVDAGIHNFVINCDSQRLLFNTENGIRWREARLSTHASDWNSDWRSLTPIHLTLEGPSCKTMPLSDSH